MKQNSTKTKAQSQNRLGIGDAKSGLDKSFIRLHSDCIMFPITQLSGRQGRGREGPPGCARSPGNKFRLLISEPVGVNPDNQPATLRLLISAHSEGIIINEAAPNNGSKNQYNNEYQYFNTKQKTNFLTQFNF